MTAGGPQSSAHHARETSDGDPPACLVPHVRQFRLTARNCARKSVRFLMAPKGSGGKEKGAQNTNISADAKIHYDEATGHLKMGNYTKALSGYNLALELNPRDKNALVARSKCYLQLGEPHLALKDAETALHGDKNFIRAIFQKAESLYHLGDFEHSLMYYHRGLRLRPELEGFRLGVQKAQEAIENTIGKQLPQANQLMLPIASNDGSAKNISSASKSRASSAISKQQSRQLLGDLFVDKEYLEKLLKHPDIKCMNQQNDQNQIASCATEGVAFLNRRQEFWRQQRPNTAATRKGKQ